jgi:hypothetical protein
MRAICVHSEGKVYAGNIKKIGDQKEVSRYFLRIITADMQESIHRHFAESAVNIGVLKPVRSKRHDFPFWYCRGIAMRPPPPMGGGGEQGGRSYLEKRFSTQSFNRVLHYV